MVLFTKEARLSILEVISCMLRGAEVCPVSRRNDTCDSAHLGETMKRVPGRAFFLCIHCLRVLSKDDSNGLTQRGTQK